jgi:farnesyl-diphosphate farnesyltransferase
LTASSPHPADRIPTTGTADLTSPDLQLQDLLERTSRTFALAIPLLPMPTRRDVTLAYLLFRIADTIEDGEILTTDEKLAAFGRYRSLLQHTRDGHLPSDVVALLSQQACTNQDYLDLLDQVQLVIGCVAALEPPLRNTIIDAVMRSSAGMEQFVHRGSDPNVRLETLGELREYCFFVAGLVGEMLTHIFLQRADSLQNVREPLLQRARWFGEGLQLVNILKDSSDDARAGRCFIPPLVRRETLFALARGDLAQASEYVDLLRQGNAPAGIVAFADLPLQLAWRTLDRVEESGAGSKLSRLEVRSILEQTVAAAGLR